MKKQKTPEIKLVVTFALKKETPLRWFASHNVPLFSLNALKSGALSQPDRAHRGMMVIITGTGLKASEEAACWIRDYLHPLFVLNIGTCGLTNPRHSIGEWIIPRHVTNEDGEKLGLDLRLPIPQPERIRIINSLLSLKRTHLNDLPDSCKEHDAVDMECYAQAKILIDAQIPFHCLKFSTDYSDQNALSDFQRNLTNFTDNVKKIFHFIEEFENPTKISVIVPVYNRQHTIKRAVDSIIAQSYKPQEIIIVDDGSTDKTKEILNSYGNKVTCISLPANSGVSRARNTGIKYARTEWVSLMDSDDCWAKDKLAKQVEYLNTYPFYEIIQSEEVWIRKGLRVNPCKHHKKPVGWIWEQSLQRCLVSPSAVLMRKSLLEKYGTFDEDLPVCEDYDLWLKISRHHPVGLDPTQSVTKYGGHKDQLSQQYSAMDWFRVRILARLLENEPLPKFRQKMIAVLEKKLNILLQGYEKHDNGIKAETCRDMLKSLKTFTQIVVHQEFY
jgi:glycosyltransferase involved in cell wall biosynthesis/nucleoside phosphorylase